MPPEPGILILFIDRTSRTSRTQRLLLGPALRKALIRQLRSQALTSSPALTLTDLPYTAKVEQITNRPKYSTVGTNVDLPTDQRCGTRLGRQQRDYLPTYLPTYLTYLLSSR